METVQQKEQMLRTCRTAPLRNRTYAAASIAAAGVFLLGLVATGCGGEAQAEAAQPKPLVTSVVGRVTAPDAFIAIYSYSNGKVVAFVCDGKAIGESLNGARGSDGQVELASKGGAKVTGTLTKEAAAGTFTTADGNQFAFRAWRPTGDRAIADRIARCRQVCA